MLFCVMYQLFNTERILRFSGDGTLVDLAAMLDAHTNGVDDMPTGYSLSDVIASTYKSQLVFAAAWMECALNMEAAAPLMMEKTQIKPSPLSVEMRNACSMDLTHV